MHAKHCRAGQGNGRVWWVRSKSDLSFEFRLQAPCLPRRVEHVVAPLLEKGVRQVLYTQAASGPNSWRHIAIRGIRKRRTGG